MLRNKRLFVLAAILAAAVTITGYVHVLRPIPEEPIGFYLLGLIVIFTVTIAVGVLPTLSSSLGPVSPTAARPELAACQKIGAVAAEIGNLLRSHLAANTEYSNSLKLSNTRLSGMLKQEDVRAMVFFLMAENNKLQTKMIDLADGLEKSRSEVASLRITLGDAEAASLRDPLTALGNRRQFELTLVKEIAAARAEGEPMCLVLADIDEFKQVNDKFGHLVGDSLLNHFSELIRTTLRDYDFAARFGGDEFAFIFPRTTPKSAAAIVERIRSQLAGKQWVTAQEGKPICKVTSSFGIVSLRPDDSRDSLIDRADVKLYQAKATGRNRILVDVAV